MEVLLLLIPLSLLLVGGIAWVMLWAARNGQFDDLEGPAHSVLMDDDSTHTRKDAADPPDPPDTGR